MSFSVVVRVYTTRDPYANPAEVGPRDSGVIYYSLLYLPIILYSLKSRVSYSLAKLLLTILILLLESLI